MRVFLKYFLCLQSIVLLYSSNINVEPLSVKDEAWFKHEFVRSFVKAYEGIEIAIGPENSPKTLNSDEDKREWLEDVANEEFAAYISKPKPNYFGRKLVVDEKPLGVCLFRLMPETKTVYLAQGFITLESQKNGYASLGIEKELAKEFPLYVKYEVLARPQNIKAVCFYKKLGYTEDKELPAKYGYIPERYVGFCKQLYG